MNFSIAISVSDSFVTGHSLTHELSCDLNKLFADKTYGDSVATIEVGFLMVLVRPGYEEWYKPKRLSYTGHRDIKSRLTGEIIERRKVLSFEIFLDENEIGAFLNGSKTESKRLLLNCILDYLKRISKLPAKAKDFRLRELILDLEESSVTLSS